MTADTTSISRSTSDPLPWCFESGPKTKPYAFDNDTPYGLGAYVFTVDHEQATRVTDRLEAGMVFVNGVRAGGVELPFGGIKRSGMGRELGRLGMEEFLNKKLVRVVG